MTDEKLIEEAAITIREADGALSHGDAVLYAEAALDVFEKAHAPTDDEREPSIEEVAAAFREHEDAPTWWDDPVARGAALRWHMRGFRDGLNARHVVQGEPSYEQVEIAWRTYEDIPPETFVMGPSIGKARERMRAALRAAYEARGEGR